jgi:carbamoyl-phosphate synthase small subunit
MLLKLVLENGEVFQGMGIGYLENLEILGEVVFNTSMTGYQEIFTDPSYCDQIIVMTYPLIGNYGINSDDYENLNPAMSGIIIKEACVTPSNWRGKHSLQDFLLKHKKVGITGIDTRKLTKILRSHGAMKGVIVKADTNSETISKLLAKKLLHNQIERVSCTSISHFPQFGGPRVVLIDFGYKKNILMSLQQRGCDVIVVPYNTIFEDIKNLQPDGILLSNGPGDPKDVPEVLPVIQKLQNNYPLFAICMGHQLFALANGADTQKMQFGNRGANHPVYDLETKRTFITSQNHGYAVTENSVSNSNLLVTQINLNDKSIEGLKHKTLKAFSVQYHPEASPGPNDTKYLFDQFIATIKGDQHAS